MKYPPVIHEKDMKFIVTVLPILAGNSRATRARVGCIIWHNKKRTIIGMGYNGTLPGSDNTMEKDNKTLESVIHAEVNAINKVGYFARRNSTLFVTHSPCLNCAQAILKSGIKYVYYLSPYGDTRGISLLNENIFIRRILW